MAAVIEAVTQPGPVAGMEAGLIDSLGQPPGGASELQLKIALHNKVQERLNADALSGLGGDRAKIEIRAALASLLEDHWPPLDEARKRRLRI